jgi:hypothetical protein
MADPLARFREIVFADTEFLPRPGERPAPLCVCARLLRSGKAITAWCDQLDDAPPYPIGDDTLFVSFAAAAELEVHLALGWKLPCHVLDLRVEHLCQTNFSEKRGALGRPKAPRKLIEILRSSGIPDGDAAVKERMVARILKGPPFTAEERQAILNYCLSDADALIPLLWKLLPHIDNLDQALRRGEAVAVSAEVADAGIPFDPWAMSWLRQREVRQAARLRLVSNENLTHGLYDGSTLRKARLDEFVLRHKLQWRRTRTGQLSTKAEVFDELARDHPEFASLAEVQKSLGLLHEFDLTAGSDNRCRTPLWLFSTITGRMAPAGSEYPFTTAAWTRNLIMPHPGTALAYLDFASMEFGAAAGLSQDAAMIEDYTEGDPYLGLGIRVGLAPTEATPGSHGPLRNKLKPLTLAMQYGGGAGLVAYRLGIERRQARRLVELHHRRYAGYWAWSDRRLYRAFAEGRLTTRDGWQCQVTSRTAEFTARNWLIQSNSSGIFRYAAIMTRRLGITICALVHDALLIEASADRIEEETARATMCLEQASRLFLHGLTLRVDTVVVREGQRFPDKRGAKVWAHVEKTLKELACAAA